MKSSILMSIALMLGVSLWMLSGAHSSVEVQEHTMPPKEEAQAPRMKVEVSALIGNSVKKEIVIQGQLEPKRIVKLRAETEGLVDRLAVEKGSRVKQGELLFSIQMGDRQAQLKRAASELKAKELELKAMRKLKSKGLQAENQLKTAQANLDAAQAELKHIQWDIQRTQIRAPFSGMLESRRVEKGTLVQNGDEFGEIVDNSLLKAVGFVPQQSAQALQLKQNVDVVLLDGQIRPAYISYVSNVAESETRSFRIEAELTNLDYHLKAGVSVEMRIAVGFEDAHFISPALLTLDDIGRVGVKAVSKANEVEFYPVRLVKNEAKGVWVSGLPHKVNVISLGQNFVRVGELVQAIEKTEISAKSTINTEAKL